MNRMLHIINGDASLSSFEAANLPGQVLVWREVMSEGPVVPQFREDSFWETRQTYICEFYEEQPSAYKEKVLDVLQELRHVHGYEELVLWFDSDLMCQVNLLFLLNFFKPLHHQKLQLATPEAGCISQLTSQQLQEVFEQRLTLRPDDLNLAQQVWQGYADESPLLLQELIQGDLHPFRHLKQALTLHFTRFPDCATGLNRPEMLMLEILHTQGPLTRHAFQQAFWEAAPGYGFGDKQIDLLMQQLQPLLVDFVNGLFQLTAAGEKAVQQQDQVPALREGIQYIGGVRMSATSINWCLDVNESKIKPAIKSGPNVP
ncbi:hypothetical protein FVR03_23280 [Pontibacter qinzhouensis]|uniref:DUF1835 domain-containing protein n=1 Tax=Pontibacter qinzhouensis TaxID=2603253 RepID=A0A5C8IKL9_9BACT|nr:DUF1835 domain-containing protein [Pontibacter qinzhouensis]TXK21639.1 hypothetical protein FVR03_23280 [Pontibacter qinzhouensis]